MTVSDQLSEIHNDLRELRGEVRDIKEETVKNTIILTDHERRSTASEDRLKILEKYAILVNWKTIATFVSIVGGIVGILKYFF